MGVSLNFDLVSILKDKGMTQAEFAKKSGIHPVTVSRLCNGTKSTEFKTLEKIANALDLTSINSLFGIPDPVVESKPDGLFNFDMSNPRTDPDVDIPEELQDIEELVEIIDNWELGEWMNVTKLPDELGGGLGFIYFPGGHNNYPKEIRDYVADNTKWGCGAYRYDFIDNWHRSKRFTVFEFIEQLQLARMQQNQC